MSRCMASITSDSGREYCEGKAGHKWHFYKGRERKLIFIVKWRRADERAIK